MFWKHVDVDVYDVVWMSGWTGGIDRIYVQASEWRLKGLGRS